MEKSMVILVDLNDNEIGTMEKLEAHHKGVLHRAFSIFVFNSKGEWLLQQRAIDKYHSGGLWTNTCCSHPFPGETVIDAGKRRLMEEMGLECSLIRLFSFIYKEPLDNQLTEYEFDHVLIGITDELPKLNRDEVKEFKYIDYNNLHENITKNPFNYTVWFRKVYEQVYQNTKLENN